MDYFNLEKGPSALILLPIIFIVFSCSQIQSVERHLVSDKDSDKFGLAQNCKTKNNVLNCKLSDSHGIAVKLVKGESCPVHSTLLSYDEAREIGKHIGGIAPNWAIMRLADKASMGGSGYNYDIKKNDDRVLGDALCRIMRVSSTSQHIFYTRKATAPRSLSLKDNSDLHYKFDYDIPDHKVRFTDETNQTHEIPVHVDSIVGFGGLSKPKILKRESRYFLWYANGKYSSDKDMHHSELRNYRFESEIKVLLGDSYKVNTHNIATMASYYNDNKTNGERVITFFKVGKDKHVFTIGSASNLNAITGAWAIELTLPDKTSIIGASAYYKPKTFQLHRDRAVLKIWLSNYKVYQVIATQGFENRFVGSINLKDMDDNPGWHAGDITSSSFSLPKGYAFTDVLGFATIDNKHEYKLYYSESSDPDKANYRMTDLSSLEIYQSDGHLNSDASTAIKSSQKITDINDFFMSKSFSSNNGPSPDSRSFTSLLWNGDDRFGLSEEGECVEAGIDVAIDIADLILDVVGSVSIAKEAYKSQFVRELNILSTDTKLVKKQKAWKAFAEKFWEPILSIRTGFIKANPYQYLKGKIGRAHV